MHTTHLVPFKVGPSAGCKTLLTAEALQLCAHTQRVAFYTFLLAPNTDYLHILHIFHYGGKQPEEKKRPLESAKVQVYKSVSKRRVSVLGLEENETT